MEEEPQQERVSEITPPRPLMAPLIAASILSSLGGGIHFSPRHRRYARDGRPCLHCQKPHNHNNAYCSAECCRQHRKKS